MKIKKKLGLLGIVSVLGVASVTGAYAGYRGTAKNTENLFTIVAGKSNDNDAATIIEPELDKILYGPDGEEGTDDDEKGDPDYLMALEPGSVLTKDPAVKSNVAYDSLVFMKVEVPLLNGTINGKMDSFEAMKLIKGETILNDMSVGDQAGDFKLMYLDKSDSPEKKSVYYFGYMNTLEGTDHEDDGTDRTSTLFDSFKVSDFTEIDGKYFTTDADIDISAFIMQNVNPATHTYYKDIDDAWDKLKDSGVIMLDE